MATLSSELRNKLERVVIDARDAAEVGARAALESLAVHHHEPYSHMKPPQRELRNHLRARARQLGDRQDGSGRLTLDHLAGECAYEHWHRMLFARFLAENGLLIEPEMGVAISLAEAEELAKEDGVDVWVFASRCAQRMLPQIFRPEDPLLQVSLATEHMLQLERLLASLPQQVFTASDALGWVYQFWQSKKKDEVNRSEVKIGADEISAVTQLFTEPYMVEFLLHNTLGAWWAGKTLTAEDAAGAKTEDELRAKIALPGVDWDYLRFVRGEDGEGGPWRPAAGTFEGWPKTAAELKILDPCCGSGHFLVAALHHSVPIRIAEEGLSAAEAIEAVLRDNLHGLEIDDRCCQIAAFALAFAAWTFPDAGGYRELPELHIACTGIGPQCSANDWVKLAEESGIPMPALGREPIKDGLRNLHRLFSQAPTLGSLIDPSELPADLITADYETIEPYLTAIHKAERADDETRERAIAAAGMVRATDLLAGEYTLVITNVPYLTRAKQGAVLRQFADSNHAAARADLATMFVDRMLGFVGPSGVLSVVTPQNWVFLNRYKDLRCRLLRTSTWNALARLGPGAFDTITGEVVKAILLIVSNEPPTDESAIATIDVSDDSAALGKSLALRSKPLVPIAQALQLRNPDCIVKLVSSGPEGTLGDYAIVRGGITTGDSPQFRKCFWEVDLFAKTWALQQAGCDSGADFGGREYVLLWEEGEGKLAGRTGGLGATIAGREVWGRNGIALTYTGSLRPTAYTGELFENVICVLVPRDHSTLDAIWRFCRSDRFAQDVRSVNQKLSVDVRYFEKAPFDLDEWQGGSDQDSEYPSAPESDDPTQWLFHGHPYEAEEDAMLQVAVARLMGYRWPAELDPNMRLSTRAREIVNQCEDLAHYADDDGIVCIPSVRGEEPAAERLFALLTACNIEPEVDLDDWLRSTFFDEHCKLFHDRPFVWHIWDGRKRDGFHALINYHKLCEGGGKGRKLLESLTYSYLGEWITRQKDGVSRGEGGAEDRLAAALELQKRLEAILEGEPPFDIFVRWKPLSEQPLGWEPDINDGVRMNIRPFLTSDIPAGLKGAGVLRAKPKSVKWTKDRGKEPERSKDEYPWFWAWDERTVDFAGGKTFDGNRWNDCHYTNKAKQAARKAANIKEGSK